MASKRTAIVLILQRGVKEKHSGSLKKAFSGCLKENDCIKNQIFLFKLHSCMMEIANSSTDLCVVLV